MPSPSLPRSRRTWMGALAALAATAAVATAQTAVASSPMPRAAAQSAPVASAPICAGEPTLVSPTPGGRAVHVSTGAQLTAALAAARPGDVITMANGVYTAKGVKAPRAIGGRHYYGTFVVSRSGTPAQPIVLQGSPNAVIDGRPGGNGMGGRYGLYLDGASHWQVRGIRVRNASKGIVLDRSSDDTLSGLAVAWTGEEGIHLRAFSSHDLVQDDVVRYTGRENASYGEGIYVGSAGSNWSTYTAGRPDRSNDDRLRCNHISNTRAENIDIKEGTSGGLIQANTLDGAGMTGRSADSWVDVKGNHWRVDDNRGTTALKDGFQVHQVRAGWGDNNVFTRNVAAVDGPGHGFWLQRGTTGNVVACNNTVRRARAGFANVSCTR